MHNAYNVALLDWKVVLFDNDDGNNNNDDNYNNIDDNLRGLTVHTPPQISQKCFSAVVDTF